MTRSVRDQVISIELGSANVRVSIPGLGMVISEPCVAAVDPVTGEALAVGAEACRLAASQERGRPRLLNPLPSGVIADPELIEKLLACCLGQVRAKFGIVQPRVFLTVPKGVTEVEKGAVAEAARRAGAGDVCLTGNTDFVAQP